MEYKHILTVNINTFGQMVVDEELDEDDRIVVKAVDSNVLGLCTIKTMSAVIPNLEEGKWLMFRIYRKQAC